MPWRSEAPELPSWLGRNVWALEPAGLETALVGTSWQNLMAGRPHRLKNIHDLDDLGNPEFRKCPEMSKCPYLLNGFHIFMIIYGYHRGLPGRHVIFFTMGYGVYPVCAAPQAPQAPPVSHRDGGRARCADGSVSITKNHGDLTLPQWLADLFRLSNIIYTGFLSDILRCLQTFGLLLWYSGVQQWGFCGLSSCGWGLSPWLSGSLHRATIVFAVFDPLVVPENGHAE